MAPNPPVPPPWPKFGGGWGGVPVQIRVQTAVASPNPLVSLARVTAVNAGTQASWPQSEVMQTVRGVSYSHVSHIGLNFILYLSKITLLSITITHIAN